MPTIISRLWESIIEARASIYDFILWLNEFAVHFFESEFATGIFGKGADFETVLHRFAALPYFVMLFALLEAFFGRRFLKAQKFVFGFIVGFAIGAVYIAPEVTSIVPLAHSIIGIAFGIVFALFRSPLYFIVFSFVGTYSFYYLFINVLSFSKFWALVCAVAAVVLLVIFLLKWLEFLGTAFLGGWIFAASLSWVIPFPDAASTILMTVIACVLALLGFTVQYLMYRHKKIKKS